MNDRTFDSDDAENQDPDEDEQRSLEDRWRRFLTGEADEERRLRMEKRREQLREERDSEEEPGEQTVGQPESEGDVETEPIPDEPDAEAPAPDEPVPDELDEEGTAGEASPRFQLEADSERARAETREERISESRLFATGNEDPGVDEGPGVDEEPAAAEDPSKPRTRAEELRALGKDRPGTAGPGASAETRTPSPGSDEPPGGAQEPPPAADRDAPVVIPARDEMDLPAWRRHWKPIAAGAALVLIAILAVRGIGGGGGGATPDEGASTAGAEAASAVDVDQAEALTDSLEAALGRYRERRQDFDLDRLDCAGLARGYEEVQSALGELRSAVPYPDDLAAGPLRSSYRSLVSSVETVEEGYADTGCADSA